MRVLVVDDATLYRKIVRDALSGLKDLTCVGVARDGVEALEKIAELKPDLVTLDQEMPRLDGLGVLRALQGKVERPQVVMISSPTRQGADVTAEALRLGALDFVVKPQGSSVEDSSEKLRKGLQRAVEAAAGGASRRRAAAAGSAEERRPVSANAEAASPPLTASAVRRPRLVSGLPPRLTLIGVSTGGPAALADLLPQLPRDYPTPVLVVQHMPKMFTRSLAQQLNEQCSLEVSEAEDGMACRAGCVYVAPGGRQMRVASREWKLLLEVTDDPPEKSCRPSVDYLFRSASEAVGDRIVAAVLTGMGDDGTLGSLALKRAGAVVIAQDEASSVVYGMPRSVVEAGAADVIVPLRDIPAVLQSIVSGEPLPCA